MPPFGYPKQRKQHKLVSVLQNRTYTILLVSALLISGYFLFSTKGFVSRLRIDGEVQETQERVIALQRDIQQLTRERDRLQHDSKAIEHVARETHGMVKPGEIVYRIVPAEENRKKK